MAETITVGTIMTRQVLSVFNDDTLALISDLFEKYDYDGIPVVDHNRKLVGIITEYDMVLQSSGVHLPTLLGIVDRIAGNQADHKEIERQFGTLKEITAAKIMNVEPITVREQTSLEEAAKVFAEHHRVNPLPVIDERGILVGIISRYDVIKFFNERYFKQTVAAVKPTEDPFREFSPTKSERDVEKAVGQLEDNFLLITKRRSVLWRYAAVAMFIAGIVAATALIIEIVKRQDPYGLVPSHQLWTVVPRDYARLNS